MGEKSVANDCRTSGCGFDIIYSSVMIFWQACHFLASGRSCTYQKTTPKQTILTPTLTGKFTPGAQSASKETRRPAVCNSALGSCSCHSPEDNLLYPSSKHSWSGMKHIPKGPH